jgi:hypothetical protein
MLLAAFLAAGSWRRRRAISGWSEPSTKGSIRLACESRRGSWAGERRPLPHRDDAPLAGTALLLEGLDHHAGPLRRADPAGGRLSREPLAG